MAVFKSQIILEMADAGWSENYFISAANHAAAITALQPIVTARMGLSRSDVKVKILRVSDVAIKGDSFLANPTTAAGTYAEAGGESISPDVALQVNFFSADHTAWTHIYVRGLSNDYLNTLEGFSVLAVPPAAFTAALTAYQNAVKAGASLYTKKPNPPGDKHAVGIDSFGFRSSCPIRKAGRPFRLRRGRRVIV